MSLPEEIQKLPNGAHFFRGDLHIHSFGASHDVTDAAMTPDAIIATCASEGLRLIAITDHNEISNVAASVAAGKAAGVYVVPGVELSTTEGHLLVYLSDISALEAFYGKLTIVERRTASSRCQTSLLDCMNLAQAHGGFAILAHVDVPDGFEARVPGAPPHKGDVIRHPALLGIEVKSPTCGISYDDKDSDGLRKGLARQRREALSTGPGASLARILSSDSHKLSSLGRNAAGAQRLTRFKMDEPSFHGLQLALRDSEARVRLEDEIPPMVPRIEAASLDGGFLHGLTIRFSPNLTCIIGGRGAGKSTLFESVRVLAQHDSTKPIVDSEAWPDHLELWWHDETGNIEKIVRDKSSDAQNADDPFGLVQFPIQSYGQSETAEASTQAQSDPSSLLRYLDQFVDLRDLRERNESNRSALLDNQSAIEEALRETERLPGREATLLAIRKQIAALDAERGKEILELERKLAEESAHRTQIDIALKSLIVTYRGLGSNEQLDTILESANPENKLIGSDQCKAITRAAEELRDALKAVGSAIESKLSAFTAVLKPELTAWHSREREERTKIEAIRARLAATGVRLDLAFIRKLASDEATCIADIKRLKERVKQLTSLRSARRQLLDERRQVLSEIWTRRTAFARQAIQFLGSALTDLTVSIKFGEYNLSPEAERIIQAAMSWRTVQVQRAALIVEHLGVPGLLTALAKGDTSVFTAIKDTTGRQIFSVSDAQEVITRLTQNEYLFQLQRCYVDDRPHILVTKSLVAGGSARPVTRDFSRLSLGQQQSVLLSLMLADTRLTPLLIDQPEDNLDSEFIYFSLVPLLRRVKERRQVIIVTHNANIAVLGDAELVIALKGFNDRGVVVASGSIDAKEVSKSACDLLEGAKEAFLRRARAYGIS